MYKIYKEMFYDCEQKLKYFWSQCCLISGHFDMSQALYFVYWLSIWERLYSLVVEPKIFFNLSSG